MGHKPRSSLLLILVLCCAAAMTIYAQSLKPAPKNQSGSPMVLLGKAVKKFLTFRVVTVQLYIAPGYGPGQIFEDIPKRIEVTYHLNIPKAELDRATIKGIEKNVSHEQLLKLMPKIEQVNSYYQDVRSSDQIVMSYFPAIGTQVMVKGQIKGIIPGQDFAKAFFAIWVGDHPVDERAKFQLLGKDKER